MLDNLEQTMLNELESCEKEEQRRIREHRSQLTATLKMLDVDYKLLEKAKSDGRKNIMFAAEVQVSKGLQEYDERLSSICNDAITTGIKFERNMKLANLMSEISSCLGTHRLSARSHPVGQKLLLGCQIQSQKMVDVKLLDERMRPWITGVAVMPAWEIAMCDRNNNKLKLVDSSDTLQGNLKLKGQPWDISVVDYKTVVLTLPEAKQLQYVAIFPQLKADRLVQLEKSCWGVHVTRDKIFIGCYLGVEVKILDFNGNLQTSLDIRKAPTPDNISVSRAEDKIFLSGRRSFFIESNSITCMTIDKHVVYKYMDDKLRHSQGLFCDGGNNILVVGRDSNNLQVITGEGKKHSELLSSKDGLLKPYSISFREKDNTLIVGCYGLNHLLLFTLGK